ncbi:hypothetical protein ACRTDM_05485 [Shewanella algae]|uniref:hypothetical protein n=1 Tax=Shewanella algae TaxID=38313 RepID=UPI000D13476D|nr:hypothetical protein [Shewanella algae]PSS68065.1 hypothetical protein AYI85_15735 [Shewanella algae]TVK96892.1 hypothetical protein AYI84_21495 [Shewanella algae]TVL52309.1 hypothetical protein AYI99_14865 [Shewanella algae]
MISYLTLLVSSVVIITGWFIAHWFASQRDHRNKKREVRLEYLINAYRSLGMAAAREPNSEFFKNLESGFHDVQLFGSSEQLTLMNDILDAHTKSGGADLEPLLNSLRKKLRTLLGLSEAELKLKFFRAGS